MGSPLGRCGPNPGRRRACYKPHSEAAHCRFGIGCSLVRGLDGSMRYTLGKPGRKQAMQMPDMPITSEVLWQGVLLVAPIDAALILTLGLWIDDATFRRRKWLIAGVTGLFFALLWGIVACYLFWDPVYRYFFPAWSRLLLPFAYGLGFGVAAWFSCGVALRVGGNCVVSFCVLTGLWGMAGHVWAIHRGLLEKPPLLRGASTAAAVIFSGFEFMFYAGVILALSALTEHVVARLQRGRRRAAASSR